LPVKCDSEELVKYLLTCVQASISGKTNRAIHTLSRRCVLKLTVAVRAVFQKQNKTKQIWRDALIPRVFAVIAWEPS